MKSSALPGEHIVEATVNCKHEKFDASVGVHRAERTPGAVAGFSAEIRIVCRDCQQPFVFLGVGRIGLSFEQPMTNIDATELRQPIAPCLDWSNGEPLPGFSCHAVPVAPEG